jgi:phosphoribosylanthranilate isomerase
LLPAVDVAGGHAVRPAALAGGAGADADAAAADPLQAALAWQRDGARWIHLVDLDAAFGRGSNAGLLTAVTAAVDAEVEIAGGVTDQAALDQALGAGAARVVIGTAALADLGWVRSAIIAHAEKVAVGLDVRDGTLSARGQAAEIGSLWPVLDQLTAAGCARYVVTDVTRDGKLSGPNLGLLRAVCGRVSAPVIASGGVSSLADLRAIAGLVPDGVEGAIIGSALYAGAFTLPEALAAVAR